MIPLRLDSGTSQYEVARRPRLEVEQRLGAIFAGMTLLRRESTTS